MEELHDSCEIVRFARRFANQINLVYLQVSGRTLRLEGTEDCKNIPLTARTVPSSAFNLPFFR